MGTYIYIDKHLKVIQESVSSVKLKIFYHDAGGELSNGLIPTGLGKPNAQNRQVTLSIAAVNFV